MLKNFEWGERLIMNVPKYMSARSCRLIGGAITIGPIGKCLIKYYYERVVSNSPSITPNACPSALMEACQGHMASSDSIADIGMYCISLISLWSGLISSLVVGTWVCSVLVCTLSR